MVTSVAADTLTQVSTAMTELTVLEQAATSTNQPGIPDRTCVAADIEKLKKAIEDRNESEVLDLLQSPQWSTLLRTTWEEKTTPFREFIKKMPKVAERVLDSCVVRNPEKSNSKSPEFEVVFDYSFVEDHGDGSKRPSNGDIPLKTRYEEVKGQAKKYFTPKYDGPPFKKSNHPLALMVKHERLNLLAHPVISSLLHHKWIHFGLWFYLLDLITYIIFLALLTSFALTVLNPLSTTCLKVHSNPGIAVCNNGTEEMNATGEFAAEYGSGMMANDTTGEINGMCVRCELTNTNFVFAGVVITIFIALVRLFIEAVNLCYDPKSYLSDVVNVIEIPLYILSITFVFVFRTTCMCSLEWQWQLGVVVIFFAWIDLIIICARSPGIGIYIIMFGNIFLTFLKAVILPVLLVIMFGLTFYMTFSEPQFQRSPFSSTASTMLKIMSMTAGDFSFDALFRRSPSGESENATEILFPRMSYVLWVIFVILMPVLFANMLVGLAVDDIQQIEKDAKLRKLALQVNVILTAEHILRICGKHKWFIRGRKTIKPNFKAMINEKLDKQIEDRMSAFGKSPEEMEKGQERQNGEPKCLQWLGQCGLTACFLRFRAWIFSAYNEVKYQLWEGERYNKLEVIEALKPDLGAGPEDEKDKVNKLADEVNKLADEHTKAILESVEKIVKKHMQDLEKHIMEAIARNGKRADGRE